MDTNELMGFGFATENAPEKKDLFGFMTGNSKKA